VTGQHTLRRKPLRLRLPKVTWRAVRLALLDLADVLWKCAVAAVASLLVATAITLIARDFYAHGEPSAAVLTVVVGFAGIVLVLFDWARRAAK
jgi:hypothetical protein